MAAGTKTTIPVTTTTAARAATSGWRNRKTTAARANTMAMMPMYLYSWTIGVPMSQGKAVRNR